MAQRQFLKVTLTKNGEPVHIFPVIDTQHFPNRDARDLWEVEVVLLTEEELIGRIGPLAPWGPR